MNKLLSLFINLGAQQLYLKFFSISSPINIFKSSINSRQSFYIYTQVLILKSKIKKAMKTKKISKASIANKITSEIMGELGIYVIYKLCSMVWTTGKQLKKRSDSLFIPLLKKVSPTDGTVYRMIALISHASKKLLNITNSHLKYILLPEIPEEQASFVPGRGIREQILNA